MNKTNKKSKVDKCPSSFTQENKDVSQKCIINEKNKEKSELRNGLVNGIVHDHDPSHMKKNGRKNKKSKQLGLDVNGEVVANKESESKSRPNENCLGKAVSRDEILEGQSSKHLEKNLAKRDNNVNNVDKQVKGSKKNKLKLGKLDSNDNISTNVSCDKAFFSEKQINNIGTDNHFQQNLESRGFLKGEPVASCSGNVLIVKNDITSINNCGSDTNRTDSALVGITSSFKDVQLVDSNEKTELTLTLDTPKPKIDFIQYESELQMPMIMKIIQKDLSEPYSIYTYRYFIHNWPKLCFLAMCGEECVGAIVCKLDLHRKVIRRGYIAMLAVDQNYRKLRIGSNLVQMAINEMIMGDADEVVLETEVTNKPALQLYEKLGFVRDKRLFRYYLNGVDALRLKLWLR